MENSTVPARQRLVALLRQPEDQLNLAEAALCIAWEDQGVGQLEVALRQLDWIADSVRPRLNEVTESHEIVALLNSYLFDELGFRGNTWSEEAANSFLDRALVTHTGLPITLSVIYLEVGWRLGLPVDGVALPGKFLTRYRAPGEEIVIDPFDGGRLWSRSECERQVESAYGGASPTLVEQMMQPPTKHAILARMLRNLKYIYIRDQDLLRALAAIERILLIERNHAQEIRDRGLLRLRLNQMHAALDDLDAYIRLAPNASDLPQLRQFASELAARVSESN